MGCDIHMHVEIRLDGKWEHWSCPDIPRNYALFGVLAGVRGDGPCITGEPRGVPADCSKVTQWAGKDDFEHTPSWVSYEEMSLAHHLVYGNPDLFDLTPELCIGGTYGLPEKDVRFVFGFDN